ncbi:Oidioi.mRNA.OKI2018_I69.chr1.g1402.t2.cds [Oikopleura dioica]|uniref:Oidioi.mRNA.OKI2018_I69.chr1.g1402.t2.cds n=1 Tax=Oikopleura dioica TaxID=34765 RepID=A0ABN7SRK7_OIKDI|nr:Oidioi.mRNA.OKI2018_I69.chr1.g1402.t2.cds [Oikopleura dioica]
MRKASDGHDDYRYPRKTQYRAPNYEPVINEFSTAKLQPFKEGWKSRHHSDRIGNNYCPKARDLKVRAIKHRPDPKVSTLSHKKLNEEYEARPEAPPSRPMSPMEQRRKAPARFLDSTSSDLERMKVLKRKIPTNDLEPLHEKSFQTILEKSNLRGRYEWSSQKRYNVNLLKRNDPDAVRDIMELFNCVAALMSSQVRQLVKDSLTRIVEFIEVHKDPAVLKKAHNYDLLEYIQKKPVLNLKLVANDSPQPAFSPSLETTKEMLGTCFEYIIESGSGLNRLELLLFPEHIDQLQTQNLFPVLPSEDWVVSLLARADYVVSQHVPNAETFLEVYSPFDSILSGSELEAVSTFIFESSDRECEDIAARIMKLRAVLNQINGLYPNCQLGIFFLDCTQINSELVELVKDLENRIVEDQVQKNRQLNRQINREYEEIGRKLAREPEDTEQLVNTMNYLREVVKSKKDALSARVQKAGIRLGFLIEFATLEDEDYRINYNVLSQPEHLRNVLDFNEEKFAVKKVAAENTVRKKSKEIEVELERISKAIEKFNMEETNSSEETKRFVEVLSTLRVDLDRVGERIEHLNFEERLLEREESVFEAHPDGIREMHPFQQLWETVNDWNIKSENWLNGTFRKLQVEEMAEDISNMWRLLFKLSKVFSDTPAPRRMADTVRTKIDKFKRDLPIIQALGANGMRPRHWDRVEVVVGTDIRPDEDTTLLQMLEFNLGQHLPKLEEIAVSAAKEYALEKTLNKMKEDWQEMKFTLLPYRDTSVSIFGGMDEIQILLDDQLIKCQALRSSPYLGAFAEDFKAWDDKLILMQDVLDVWLKVQAAWLYLEPIFSSEDIMAQMPEEGRRFTIVDGTWKECMAATAEDPSVLVATDQPGLLGRLREALELLELIQKGLNDYLEEKRLFFNRFFFLSNDELLEILSETKDPTRVQPHLKKCFEGIAKLNFNAKLEILAMISSEKEEVPFDEKIDPALARGMVEKWLLQVEESMLKNIRRVSLAGTDDYAFTKRAEWVQKWPGQVVLSGSQVFWTSEAEEAIKNGSLKTYCQKLTDQIGDIVLLVRSKLPTGIRTSLSALTVLDVHARDVIKELAEENISNVNDFDWLKQVRYYINKDGEQDEVYVHLINTEYPYGYEYLGNSPRLVITPLTDRCYRTLMGALKLNLGGAPEGPAGTGKTETTKDLAKALAKQCVVFNCSDGLDYKAMGKFFKGLAACGAWACFDEFNRIEIEVLSVVAQQILCIQKAVGEGKTRFNFEGTDLNLNAQCAVFITMNPGYAGRSELPDNLKVLFRPVAMMVPDYGMIGEISLYSMGFGNSRSLAQKIVATYKLCSEQLSSQHHYDYGMRAVKSVLTAAGNLKLQQPEEDESILMLRAIIDVNLPKFLAQDVPLFNGIVSDLFPGTELPQPDYITLNATIEKVMRARNLDPTDWVKTKIQQIYEMMIVRHGFMIVGATMGGKTVNYSCLAEALTIMSEDSEEILPIEYRVINPKSITMNQLYGSFDPVSHEWSDGVLAINYREQANLCGTKNARQWLIFDGPVDAVWIENMNTVLDDNKKLCLMSGEIIQMGSTMSMIFEPADLEQASPATVSRCGMIYLEPYQLGWKPLVKCFMSTLPSGIQESEKEMLMDMFNWLFTPCLEFLGKQKFMMSSGGQHMTSAFLKLFDANLDEWRSGDELSLVQASNWLIGLFQFSLIWSFGATLSEEGREQFNRFLRPLLSGMKDEHPRPKTIKMNKLVAIPEKGLVHDYCFLKKANGQWESWRNLIEAVEFPASISAREMIIPNATTVQQNYFLNTLVQGRQLPLLFVGPTGTGKTALTQTWLMKASKTEGSVGYLPLIVNFSARTTAHQTQDAIMVKMDRRRKGIYGPPVGKRCLVFVDDLSLPQKETYGAKGPIELLRTWLDLDFFYDLKDMTKFQLQDVQFLAAMGPPSSGNTVDDRMARHMNIISLPELSDEAMSHIFSTITSIHMKRNNYDASFQRIGLQAVQATLNLFTQATKTFLPTPTKSHYIFNLRDFSRVTLGCLQTPPSQLDSPEKFIRLWVHESNRVFADRLVDADDQRLFFEIIKSATNDAFKVPLEKLLSHLSANSASLEPDHVRSLFFGDFAGESKVYNEISDMTTLKTTVEGFLEEYNQISTAPMSLVMFRFAIEHISRVCRVLAQPGGMLSSSELVAQGETLLQNSPPS